MANNNDFDPNIMQQLMQMYREGKIPNMNPNTNNNQNMGMNPNMNMNQNMNMNPNMNMNQKMGMNPNMMFNFPPFPFFNQGNMNFPNQPQPQPPSAGENWTIYFKRKYDNQKVTIQINSDNSVMAAFSKYRIKSLENDIPLKFSYKGKPLDSQLSLSASGLTNNSEIEVEKINIPKPQVPIDINPPPGFLSLIFDVKNENKLVNIQIESNKTVKDAIDAYFKKTKGKEGETIFVFNSKTLRPELSLAQAGLTSGSKILAISLVDLEGAV